MSADGLARHPLVQRAISSFGVESWPARGVMKFLRRPGVNVNAVRPILLPHGDFIAHDLSSESQIFSSLLPREERASIIPMHDGNWWDHGDFILSTTGVNAEGKMDYPAATPFNIALSNASMGALPLEDSVKLSERGVGLEHVTEVLNMRPSEDMIWFARPPSSLARNVGRGLLVGDPGDSIPGVFMESEYPVAIWDGRQVVPHSRYVLPDQASYPIIGNNFAAQFMRAQMREQGLDHRFVVDVEDFYRREGIDKEDPRITMPTRMIAAYEPAGELQVGRYHVPEGSSVWREE